MATSDGGKGSSPRPFSVSNEEYAQRWDAIFGKDKPACTHDVWTHTGNVYKCIECGLEAEKPYFSR